MKKKLLSIILAGTLASSMVAVGAISASAEDEPALSLGDYGSMGEYTPSAGVKTNHLMFAMPGAWQNDTTKDEKCNGVAGIYWWSGYDTPDDKAGGHGWPGWKTVKVEEEGVDNLFAIDVPTYYNGEKGNATQIIWNNYIDGGMETDPVKNPFYDAACQTKDFPGQYYSRYDENKTFEPLFRYIYKTQAEKAGMDCSAIDLNADTFWEDINKAAAEFLGDDWDSLDNDERTIEIDSVIDGAELDFSEFGEYASNFFNEDLVDEDYPNQEVEGYCLSFTFDNMVFVVSFDPDKMQKSPVSGKIGFDGEFFFYYGGGEYGSWPTKELNEANGGVSGNFTSNEYLNTKMEDLSIPTDPATEAASVPAPATDATSGTSTTNNQSNSANNANGAIATGQISFAVIVFVVLMAGVGAVYFTRKKRED